jgi:hypothetical protein
MQASPLLRVIHSRIQMNVQAQPSGPQGHKTGHRAGGMATPRRPQHGDQGGAGDKRKGIWLEAGLPRRPQHGDKRGAGDKRKGIWLEAGLPRRPQHGDKRGAGDKRKGIWLEAGLSADHFHGKKGGLGMKGGEMVGGRAASRRLAGEEGRSGDEGSGVA